MALHPQLVEFLAESVIADLEREGAIKVADDRQIIGLVENVIEDEMERVMSLDDEVREILNEHYEQMRSSGLNYDEMFRKVKSKLAAERGIVL